MPIVGDAGKVLEALLAVWKRAATSRDDKALAGLVAPDRRSGAARDCLQFTPGLAHGAIIKPQYALSACTS